MRPDDWHLTEDVDDFLARTGDFLRSRPALHTLPLTVTGTLRTRGRGTTDTEAPAPTFGWLERAGGVQAAFFRTPPHRLNLTPLAPEHADSLAVRLADLGHPLPGISADHDTAAAFAEAWQKRRGATPTHRNRQRLYRLDELTPPRLLPEGRGRVAGERDHDQLLLWYREFAAAIGEVTSWADTHFADRRITLWESPDGTSVSMAGVTPIVADQVRVAPVYTPPHLRGHGYGAAVTVDVSRAALAEGAREVVLFADLANPTSNHLYQRIGYVPVADFSVYDFSHAATEPPL
jgi:predicted GNAT family acetyltransferase